MSNDYWEIAIQIVGRDSREGAVAFTFLHNYLTAEAFKISGDREASKDIASQCVCGLLENSDGDATVRSGKSLKRKARYLSRAWQEKESLRKSAEHNFVNHMQELLSDKSVAQLSDLRQRVSRIAALLEPAQEKAVVMYLVCGYSLEQVSLLLRKPPEKTRLELIHAVRWLHKLAAGPCPADLAYLRHRRRISDAS